LKIKNFMKYFKKRGLEVFQKFHEIFKYFKVKYFIVHLYSQATQARKSKHNRSWLLGAVCNQRGL